MPVARHTILWTFDRTPKISNHSFVVLELQQIADDESCVQYMDEPKTFSLLFFLIGGINGKSQHLLHHYSFSILNEKLTGKYCSQKYFSQLKIDINCSKGETVLKRRKTIDVRVYYKMN
uniref:Chromosomal replication initiator protein DnaA n=1 Tax=Lygus hesperus TaxID=30085 RepID=A0A0A9XYY4_LYGHE